jgi:hypothetical protein
MEIPAAAGRRVTKYGGNRVEIDRASLPAADRLGEIVNPAAISTYFTERSGVYFQGISIVFPATKK